MDQPRQLLTLAAHMLVLSMAIVLGAAFVSSIRAMALWSSVWPRRLSPSVALEPPPTRSEANTPSPTVAASEEPPETSQPSETVSGEQSKTFRPPKTASDEVTGTAQSPKPNSNNVSETPAETVTAPSTSTGSAGEGNGDKPARGGSATVAPELMKRFMSYVKTQLEDHGIKTAEQRAIFSDRAIADNLEIIKKAVDLLVSVVTELEREREAQQHDDFDELVVDILTSEVYLLSDIASHLLRFSGARDYSEDLVMRWFSIRHNIHRRYFIASYTLPRVKPGDANSKHRRTKARNLLEERHSAHLERLPAIWAVLEDAIYFRESLKVLLAHNIPPSFIGPNGWPRSSRLVRHLTPEVRQGIWGLTAITIKKGILNGNKVDDASRFNKWRDPKADPFPPLLPPPNPKLLT